MGRSWFRELERGPEGSHLSVFARGGFNSCKS